MTRRNTPLEVEQVEQLALIARLPPHHGESPSLISSNDGITVRQFSRALFQQHRPNSDIEVAGSHPPRPLPNCRRPSNMRVDTNLEAVPHPASLITGIRPKHPLNF